VLPLRGVLFALFSTNPFAVVAIQLLDGAAGFVVQWFSYPICHPDAGNPPRG